MKPVLGCPPAQQAATADREPTEPTVPRLPTGLDCRPMARRAAICSQALAIAAKADDMPSLVGSGTSPLAARLGGGGEGAFPVVCPRLPYRRHLCRPPRLDT